MSALRKIQWQESARHACPDHPDCSMQRVQVQGRELWACNHPEHVTNVSALKAGVIPARLRAKSLPDTWRVIPPPLYVLPDPQPTGSLRPVPVAAPIEQETPHPRPDWLTQLETHRLNPSALPTWLTDEPLGADRWLNQEHTALQDVTEQDCKPVLDEDEITVAEPNKALYQLRLLARRKESE